MHRFKKIAVLDNMVEAQVLDAMLTEQGIPHVMRTYGDSAYDGVFQGPRGWGHLEAPEQHRAEIMALLEDLRRGAEDGAE